MAFFDPTRAAYRANPYPSLAALRTRAPLHWSIDLKAWIATRYANCSEVLHDGRRFTSDPTHTSGARAEAITAHRGAVPLGSVPHLGTTSGEAHRRMRSLVNPVFTPSAARNTEAVIRRLVEEALCELPVGETCDFMELFANPLPRRVMASVLGCPPDDAERLQRALSSIEITRSAARPSAARLADSRAAAATAADVLGPYPDGALPAETVLGALMPTGGCGLGLEEITSVAAHIATVGSDPTTGGIANSVAALTAHPDATDELRRDPAKMRGAVHELLRFDSPSHIVPRFAAIDTELGGKRIRRGDAVLAMVGAANRDPLEFAEPDTLDIERDARRELSFGQGEHICLGAPLALTIMEIALSGFLRRFKRVELVAPPEYGPSVQLRIPDRLLLRCE